MIVYKESAFLQEKAPLDETAAPLSSPCRWEEQSGGSRAGRQAAQTLPLWNGSDGTGVPRVKLYQLTRSGPVASGLQSAAGKYRCCHQTHAACTRATTGRVQASRGARHRGIRHNKASGSIRAAFYLRPLLWAGGCTVCNLGNFASPSAARGAR